MKSYLRFWREIETSDIEKHLIVLGDLSCDCYACHHIGIDRKATQCPNCGAHFKYMAFRRKVSQSQMRSMAQEMPYLTFIDFEDFKAITGKSDARRLLDL